MKLITKMGFYSIYEDKGRYIADSGKIIYSKRFKKYYPNPYRDVKDFGTIEGAKEYVFKKLSKHTKDKEKKIKSLPKSLYLILMKEQKSGLSFVKVGITSKRFLIRRFSKDYGYEGYVIETVLRRIDTEKAEEIEQKIKDTIAKKKTIKKFRPLLENFSGYSECFSYNSLSDIVGVFDKLTKNL